MECWDPKRWWRHMGFRRSRSLSARGFPPRGEAWRWGSEARRLGGSALRIDSL